jgi:hypothetical protein
MPEVSTAVGDLLQAANQSAMRSSLGLGNAAVLNTGTGTGQVVVGGDSRLTNARTPTAHANSHLTGSDQIPDATTDARGLMSSADKTKLNGIASGANNYTLPTPTPTTIGGVKRNAGVGGQFVSGVDSAGNLVFSTPSGAGDVVGPASAVDGHLVLFNGSSGKLIKTAGIDGSNLVPGSRQVATQHSVEGGGDLSTNRTVRLVGDEETPAASRYYGTNAGGVRGFHAIPVTPPPTVKNSIQFDAGSLQLVGDAASPGASQYYGTNPAGTRGFHAVAPVFPSTKTESGAAVALALGDVGRYVRLTGSGAITVTVLQQSSVNWPADAEIQFRIAGTGSVSIAEGAGVTVNNRTAVNALTQHANFTLKRVGENVWDLVLR